MKNKVQMPKISIVDEKDINYAITYGFNNLRITDSINAANVELKDITFDSCEFIKVDFTKFMFKNIYFLDSTFINCDFSNMDIDQTSIKRCIFKDCKMIGTNITNNSISDVIFENVSAKLINFCANKFQYILFKNSDFCESRMMSCISKECYIENCCFNKSEFFDNQLKGCDFSTSTIEEITVDLASIKEIIVNSEQAISLSRLLGIIIK